MLLKLAPSPEQQIALLETMHAFNAACNDIAQTAFDEKLANKFELQKIVYGDIRTRFKLSSQMAIRAISKVVDSYKRDKSIKPSFRKEGAITYDERLMAFKGLNEVSFSDPARARLGTFPYRWVSAISNGRDQGTSRSALSPRDILSCSDA